MVIIYSSHVTYFDRQAIISEFVIDSQATGIYYTKNLKFFKT